MRKLLFLMIVLSSLLLSGAVLAQEGFDPNDNWCYDGGPLEGRCTTNDEAESKWLWLYGFFRAQIAKGALSVNDIPEEYRIGITGSSSGSNAVVLDEDGNAIGTSKNFQGTISTCTAGESSTLLGMIWLGLDQAGDRISISTDEGSVSRDMYVPVSDVDVNFRIGDRVLSITPGGTMSVYYRGVLIGRSSLNGLNKCTDSTTEDD